MSKSRKHLRKKVRNTSPQKATVTYTYDDTLGLWFAVVISRKTLVATVDGDTIEEVFDDEVVPLLKMLNLRDAEHHVDLERTPQEKQVEASAYLQARLFGTV